MKSRDPSLGSTPAIEEGNRIAAATNGVCLTGNIASRPNGTVIGPVDIGIGDNAYMFKMCLPCIRRDAGNFSCEIERNERVVVKGISVPCQKKVCEGSQIFEMQTQNLCPPGPFSVSFQFPGPVEPRGFIGKFHDDGIFEAVVARQAQQDPTEVEVEDNASTPVK